MNFRLTFILAIILLVLASTLIWMKSRPEPEKATPGGTTALIDPKPVVKGITYIRDGATELKFTRDGDNWTMVAPVNAAVNKFQVDDIANSFSGMTYTRKFEPDSTNKTRSAEYTGTANPREIVKLVDDKGKEHTIAFGKMSPEGIFATLDGAKTIYVLNVAQSNPLDQLAVNPDTFRNKQMKTVDVAKIVKLEIKYKNDTTTLEKTDNKWLITKPVSARAQATVVDDIVKEFANINAVSFAPPRLTRKSAIENSPSGEVTAYIDESAPATAPATTSAPATQRKLTPVSIAFGVFSQPLQLESSNVYASLSGSNDVFVYNRQSYNKLTKELKDLRDPAITPAQVSQATDVVVTEGQNTISLNKKDGTWNLTAPVSLKADAYSVSDYLSHISQLRAIKFVDNAGNLPAIGLDPPQMKIEMSVPGQSQREVILVGKPETADAVTPMMRQGEQTVYLVQTKELDALKVTPVSLRDKEIERMDASTIRSIDIKGAAATPGVARAGATTGPATAAATAPATGPALPPGVTLEMQATRWMLTKDGKSEAADESKIQSLISSFSPLSALKYVDDKPFASGTPDITVAISMLEKTPEATTLPVSTRPATAPATGPATGPASAPATMAAEPQEPLPAIPTITVDPGKVVTRTLRLYKAEADGKTTWKAVWETQSPTWTFEPTPALIELLTKDVYNADAPKPAPTTAPVTMPPLG